MRKIEIALKEYFPIAKEINIYPSEQYFVEDEDGEVLGVLEDYGSYFALRVDGEYITDIDNPDFKEGGL